MDLEALFNHFRKEDPNFGKVDNSNPAEEFSFDIPGGLTVGQVAAFTDAEAAQRITGIDDYGKAVTEIPVGQTCGTFEFPFCERAVPVPFTTDKVSTSLFVHVAALLLTAKICEHPEHFKLSLTRDEVLALRFYRFNYDPVEKWWSAVFDDLGNEDVPAPDEGLPR